MKLGGTWEPDLSKYQNLSPGHPVVAHLIHHSSLTSLLLEECLPLLLLKLTSQIHASNNSHITEFVVVVLLLNNATGTVAN